MEQILKYGVGDSVSRFDIKTLSEKYKWSDNLHVNGLKYFTNDGITLSKMRSHIENEVAKTIKEKSKISDSPRYLNNEKILIPLI